MESQDRPFFLYDAKPRDGKQNYEVYAAMIESMDESVGRVLDALRDAGVEDNTCRYARGRAMSMRVAFACPLSSDGRALPRPAALAMSQW